MQTERVTFLTSRDHKAALDAYAAAHGLSVGHLVREATARYMAEERPSTEEQAVLDLLVDELERSLPIWSAKFDSMEASIAEAREAIRAAVASAEEAK